MTLADTLTPAEITAYTAAAGGAGALVIGWGMKLVGFFDSRRDKYVAELKTRIDDLEKSHAVEREANATERTECEGMRREVDVLRTQILILSAAGDTADPLPRWMTRDGLFVWGNRAMERELLKPQGLRLGDIQGKRPGEVFPTPFAETLGQLAKEVLASPDGEACAVNVVYREGSPTCYMVRSQSCEMQGVVFGHIGVAMRQPRPYETK